MIKKKEQEFERLFFLLFLIYDQISNKYPLTLDQNTITMIHFVLNDLSRPTGVGLHTCLQFQSLILHLDGLITLAFAWTA